MLENTLLREILIVLIILTFIVFVLWAIFFPKNLSNTLWYDFKNSTGWNEFSAIYIWIFSAHIALWVYAFINSSEAIFWNMLAILLLSQPFWRIFWFIRFGKISLFMTALLLLEIFWWVALLLVQPS